MRSDRCHQALTIAQLGPRVSFGQPIHGCAGEKFGRVLRKRTYANLAVTSRCRRFTIGPLFAAKHTAVRQLGGHSSQVSGASVANASFARGCAHDGCGSASSCERFRDSYASGRVLVQSPTQSCLQLLRLHQTELL